MNTSSIDARDSVNAPLTPGSHEGIVSVISKVTPDLEPTPPPPRTPVPRSGPGSRIRSLPAPLPLVPPPVAPAHIPPPVLLPPPPPPAPVFQAPVSQAKARGCSVVTETVSAYVIRDEWGNKIWICPGCNKPDDGSPMIGCDECDDWYHCSPGAQPLQFPPLITHFAPARVGQFQLCVIFNISLNMPELPVVLVNRIACRCWNQIAVV
ncbi:Transcription initiation factor TFIID subunit 3 [Bagarius yarrelli]|uniref:Transcription initiation factor TFIID subunit 3 n=1 Tax=Bagarius yarrelli TaxID=175774 RepID=A0A556TH25_BAGYA|nr:Transcription initiation factor TFIID subunit 3 [Bagarius yarrelli]